MQQLVCNVSDMMCKATLAVLIVCIDAMPAPIDVKNQDGGHTLQIELAAGVKVWPREPPT